MKVIATRPDGYFQLWPADPAEPGSPAYHFQQYGDGQYTLAGVVVCSSCGTINDARFNRCGSPTCGQYLITRSETSDPVTPVVQHRACKHCGHLSPPNASNCHNHECLRQFPADGYTLCGRCGHLSKADQAVCSHWDCGALLAETDEAG